MKILILLCLICYVSADVMTKCQCTGFEDYNGPYTPLWSFNKDLSLIGNKLKCDFDDRKLCKDYCIDFYRNTTDNFNINATMTVVDNEKVSLGQYFCNLLGKEYDSYINLGALVTCKNSKGKESSYGYDLMLLTDRPFGFKVKCYIVYKFDSSTNSNNEQ